MDRIDHWLDRFDYHQDARVAHVMAMIAHNKDLSYGKRFYFYDTVGAQCLCSRSPLTPHLCNP
jgi:hypothetical protein